MSYSFVINIIYKTKRSIKWFSQVDRNEFVVPHRINCSYILYDSSLVCLYSLQETVHIYIFYVYCISIKILLYDDVNFSI